MVAALHPLPPVPSSVRKLPAPSTKGAPAGPAVPRGWDPVGARAGHEDLARDVPEAPIEVSSAAQPKPRQQPANVTPLAPECYKVQFTMSRATHDKLRCAQDLLRHAIPNGDPAAIFDRALTLLVAELERPRLAATTRPRRSRDTAPGSRHVPAATKREVWARDQGRCAFVGTTGRCTERGFLEVHHVVPFAAGGPTVSANLELRCRAHNQYEADLFFGTSLVREARTVYYAISGVEKESLVERQAVGGGP